MNLAQSERLPPDLILQSRISHDGRIRLRQALFEVIRRSPAEQITEIDAICDLLSRGTDRNSLVQAVLSVPHPRFIAALEERFGPDMLSGLTTISGSPCEAYDHFKPSVVSGIDRDFMIAFLPRISSRAVRVCTAAANHASQSDDLDLILSTARAVGASEAQLFSWFPTILPFEQDSVAIHGWAGRVFDEQISTPDFLRSSRPRDWLSSSNVHLFSALLASGADLREHIAATTSTFGSVHWVRALKSLPQTNHARLAVQAELAAIGPSAAIFASPKAKLTEVILKTVEP